MPNLAVHYSQNKPTWETPDNLLALIGTIDLDPCTNLMNPTDAKAICVSPEEYKQIGVPRANNCSISCDGLQQDWNEFTEDGLVYVNPPYGSTIADWLRKGFHHNLDRFYLLPVRTDTKWFHNFIDGGFNIKKSICFMKGRLKFKGATSSAPFPSMLVYYPKLCPDTVENLYRFKSEFSKIGMIV